MNPDIVDDTSPQTAKAAAIFSKWQMGFWVIDSVTKKSHNSEFQYLKSWTKTASARLSCKDLLLVIGPGLGCWASKFGTPASIRLSFKTIWMLSLNTVSALLQDPQVCQELTKALLPLNIISRHMFGQVGPSLLAWGKSPKVGPFERDVHVPKTTISGWHSRMILGGKAPHTKNIPFHGFYTTKLISLQLHEVVLPIASLTRSQQNWTDVWIILEQTSLVTSSPPRDQDCMWRKLPGSDQGCSASKFGSVPLHLGFQSTDSGSWVEQSYTTVGGNLLDRDKRARMKAKRKPRGSAYHLCLNWKIPVCASIASASIRQYRPWSLSSYSNESMLWWKVSRGGLEQLEILES